MVENGSKRLSRRSRTILAVDSALMHSGDDPRRISKQDIATAAANWTTDPLDMFAEPGEDEFEDYYEIVQALMHIVHALRQGGGE